MTWYNQDYVFAGRMEFRRAFKRDFYAYSYSNGPAMKTYKDFCKMYDMGGEL